MGGRGSTSSAIVYFGRKSGTRFTPKQYKSAVSDQADFILQNLRQAVPKQLIIKKSFKGGFAQVSIDTETKNTTPTEAFKIQLENLASEVSTRLSESKKEKQDATTWSAYDYARAKTQIYAGIDRDIQKLRKKYK